MGETAGVNVLSRAASVDISPQLNGYAGVRIYAGKDDEGNDRIYEAGLMDAQVLEIKNPFGTQEMANNILADIMGYQYQPMTVSSALLNPAAEMGDGVTANGVYSGIFVRATRFGALMLSDVSAPTNEEIEHEFAIESPSDRQYSRFVQQTKALLKVTSNAITAEVSARQAADSELSSAITVTASQIRAEVVAKEGGNTSSFGWRLNADSHTWYSGSTPVMKVDSTGLSIKGQLEVGTSIGSGSGFVISATAIYKNISQFGGTQTSGVYIGTDGIQLGQGFKVDATGNLTASSGTFTGSVNAGSIRSGGTYGTFSGQGITAGTMPKTKLDADGESGIDGGNAFFNAFKWNVTLNDYEYNGTMFSAPYIRANGGIRGQYYIGNAGGGQMNYRTLYFQPLSVSGFDSYGNPRTITANFVTV